MFSHLSQSSLHSRSRQAIHKNDPPRSRREGNRRKHKGTRSVVSCATTVPSMRIKSPESENRLHLSSALLSSYISDPASRRLLSKSVPRGIHSRVDSDTNNSDLMGSTSSSANYGSGSRRSLRHRKTMRVVAEHHTALHLSEEAGSHDVERKRGDAEDEEEKDEEEEQEEEEEEEDDKDDDSDEEICQPCCRPGRAGVITWIKNMVVHQLQETPAWYMLILLAIQFLFLKIMTCFVLYNVIVFTFKLEGQPKLSGQILSGMLFMSGMSVIMQIFVGVRLPMIQGLSLATMIYFNSNGVVNNKSPQQNWKSFASEMSFVSMVLGSFQLLMGLFGVSGLLMRFIGPLTVSPLLIMYSIFLCPLTINYFEINWIMTVVHLALSATFICLLGVVRVPFCATGQRARCKLIGYPLFRVLGFLIATVTTMLIDASLHEVLPPSEHVFIPANSTGSDKSMQWAYIPIPLLFGWPKPTAMALGKAIPVALVLMLKSIHDYFSTARNCRVSPPPNHAVNRGQFIEGLCSLISGCLGLPPVSTDSGHIGLMALANVASRSVFVATGIALLVLSLFPRPVFYLAYFLGRYSGSVLVFYVAMTTANGLTNLYFVNMVSTRNQLIAGFSIVLGYMIPRLISPGAGTVLPDILLCNPIVFATIVGFFLDLLLPTKYDDNGRIAWIQDESRFSRHFGKLKINTKREFFRETPVADSYINRRHPENDKMSLMTDANIVKRSQLNMYVNRVQRSDVSIYDLPFVATDTLLDHSWTTRIPILPSFGGHITWIHGREEHLLPTFVSVSERNLAQLV